MSFIRLLLGRRQFLTASLSSALMLAFGRISRAFDLLFKTDTAKAAEKTKSVGKRLRGIVVYYSATGNTAQVANAIYKGMKSVIACDVVPIKKMDPKKMTKYDVMAIGSPNWYMREVAVLKTFTHDMPRMDRKHCVIFGTHGGQPLGQYWSMSKNVLKKGMTIIGWGDWYGPDFLSPHGRVPHGAWGHPDSIDLAEAEAFGKRMAEYSIRIYAGETELIPEIPTPEKGQNSLWSPLESDGNITFASPPPDSIPQFDLTKCVYPRCTQCVENCPVNAIDFSVLTAAGSITSRDSVITQDELFDLDWTNPPPDSTKASPLILKNACQHCGGLCQRVCNYDAIAYLGEKINITINMEKCTYPRCTICSDECPQNAIDLTKNPPVIHNRCEAEGLCWGLCPENAIEVPNMAEVQLKKAWWFKGMGMPPFMGGGEGEGGEPTGVPIVFSESNPRLRNLVRKADNDNIFGIMYITEYPRVPLKKDLWPYNIDEES